MARRTDRFVVAALPNAAFQILSSSLPSSLRLLYVKDYAEAVEVLRNSESVALVVAGLHFDDSRVFDLIKKCQERRPPVRVVCCRLIGTDVSPVFLEAVRLASEGAGCSFFDFPALAASSDEPSAHKALRTAVLAQLEGPPRRRPKRPRPVR